MEMSIEEAIKRFQSNAEYERTHGNLQGCLEFRQLAEWLEQLQKIEQIVNAEFEEYHPLDRNIYRLALIRKVIEDEK